MAVQSIAIGTVFGRLTVIGDGEPYIDKHGWKHGASRVLCECGTEKSVRNGKLQNGSTVSCGCLRLQKSVERIQLLKTHGRTKTSEHRAWTQIKSRCSNNKDEQKYANYGGRGIQVCERWMNSFEAFLEDMGPRPSAKHSIDRFPNNDGNYEPGNCRWATSVEQCNNKRNNVLFTFYGKTMTLTQWSEISQVDRSTVEKRLKSGWSEKKAFWTPARVNVRHRTPDS